MDFRINSILLLLLCGAAALPAQKIALETSLYQGQVWRHTPKLRTQTGETIAAQELTLCFQTTGRHDWQAWQRYPMLGISTGRFGLGEGSHGNAVALWPHITVSLLRAGRWSANFRVGTGLAWVTKPYHWHDNPTQNAIGSHWNNITQFRLGAAYRATAHWRLSAGGGMTHFSNGSAALPNFGINIFSGWAGAAWFFKPLKKEDFRPATHSKRTVQRRLGGQLQGGMARVEFASLDGPKYAIWTAAAAAHYHFSRTNRVSAGLDYELNKAVLEWGLHSARFADETTARRGATRLGVFVAEEFLFGDIGLHLSAGQYVGKNINQYVPKSRYAKLSARYYLPALLSQSDLKMYLGISIKAHKFTAEYIAGNVGLSW